MYLMIETNTNGGSVREVRVFDDEDEAIDFAIDVAGEDGYLDDNHTAEALRQRLAAESCYEDSGVLTTIFYLEG